MTTSPDVTTVGDAVAALDRLYPPETAEEWDAVGLVCGDRVDAVRRVLFAVDPLPQVIDEAVAWEADLLVTHHPLLLRGVHGVSTDTWKGRALHRLIRAGCALYTAHTNADVASGGVNDALADCLGLRDTRPLRPWPAEPTDKVVTFVPTEQAAPVLDAMAAAGGARPTVGTVGTVSETEQVAESRIEVLVPRRLRDAVLEALRAAHPCEQGAVDVYELAMAPADTGLGRVGDLDAECSLAELAARVAAALPMVPGGVRCFGPPGLRVRRIAVCGGAGDSLLADAAAVGADVFVTADLRHHPASEHLAGGGPALVDPGHWASEWPWLPVAAEALNDALGSGRAGVTTVETRVSTVVSDPVTAWFPSR